MIFPETVCFYALLFASVLILQATVPPPIFFGAVTIFFLRRKLFCQPQLNPYRGEFYYLLFLAVLFGGIWLTPDFSRPTFVFLRYLFLYLLWHDFQKNTDREEKENIFKILLYFTVFMSIGGIFQVFFSPDPMPVSWGNPDGLKRAFGLFDNPNLFASFLMLPLLGLLFAEKLTFKTPVKLGLAFLLLFLLILTQSRGAIIAFCGTLCLLLPFVPYKKLISLFLLLCLSGFFATGRMKTLEKTNLGVNQRIELYQGIKKYIQANWLTGTSPGSFHLNYPRYRTLGGYYPLYAHNHLLEIICESGIIGLTPFLIWLLFAGLKAFKAARQGVFLPIATLFACILNAQTNSSFSLFVICLSALFIFCLDLPPQEKAAEKTKNKLKIFFNNFCFGFIFYWLTFEFQVKEIMQSPEPLQHITAKIGKSLKTELAPALQRIEITISISENPAEIAAARQWLDELKKAHPHEAEIPFLQARIMLATDHKNQAEELLKEAMKLDPWSEKYAHTLLSLWLYMGKYNEFTTLAERIMGSNPDYLTENPWYEKIKELQKLLKRIKE
jgi:O-antigen ligase